MELSESNIDYDWFCSLQNKHKGKEAWLFGKGPSFSKYKTLKPEGVIATINEACYYVDDIDYAFTWYADKKDIRPKTGEVIDGSRGYNIRDIKEYSPNKKAIFMYQGTGELAVSYLIWMGVKLINFVGIDGTGKYSKEFKWENPKNITLEDANSRRLLIKERMKHIMNMAGVKCVDHSICRDYSSLEGQEGFFLSPSAPRLQY
jgi:hypothetical protein